MFKNIHTYLSIALFLVVSSCSVSKQRSGDDQKISITLVQVNDVYEIAALSGGKEGGLARVAGLKKKYQAENMNTRLVMAGDFLSPSVYNSLRYENKSIRGRQMVAAMNSAGFDYVVFGNHEFDIRESELQERINESSFRWISSNTFHKMGETVKPFSKISYSREDFFPKYIIESFTDADGTNAKVGFIGLTLPFNKAPFVSYTDALATAKELYALLKDSVDAVVAITHQSIEEDEQLAREIPGLAAIMGGHEHDQVYRMIGRVPITKAMANAKTAYIVNLGINKKKKSTLVETKLEVLNEQVDGDSATASVVAYWTNIANQSFSSLGFDAGQVIIDKHEPLDGRETEVRNKATNLSELIVSSMQHACKDADVVILNGGSIRVDDILPMPVTQYDIIRALPFGGSIREVDVTGAVLERILEAGKLNKGTGGFLHYNKNLVYNNEVKEWKLDNKFIDETKTYRLALPEFLLTGGESRLDFLKPDNESILRVYDLPADASDPGTDIRKAVIAYLKTTGQ